MRGSVSSSSSKQSNRQSRGIVPAALSCVVRDSVASCFDARIAHGRAKRGKMNDRHLKLNDRLAARELTHEPSPKSLRIGLYDHDVKDATGAVLFTGDALEVSYWLNKRDEAA